MIFLVRTLPYVLGSSGLEPPTSRLSGARSNQLSYEPASLCGSTRLSSFELQHFLLSGFSLVSFKQSTGLFEFPSGTVPFRIPSFFFQKTRQARLPPGPLGPFDGDDGIRTHDPLLAGQVLSQLSYTPIWCCGSMSFLNELYHSLKIEQQPVFAFAILQTLASQCLLHFVYTSYTPIKSPSCL